MLNEKQLLYIRTQLDEKGLTHQGVKDELLDHICCSIEMKMQAGAMFSIAARQTFESFAENELLQIEANAVELQKYKWLNRRTLLLGLLLLFLISGVYWWSNLEQQHLPSIAPVASNKAVSNLYPKGITPIYKVTPRAAGIDLTVPYGTAVVSTAKGKIADIKTLEDHRGFEISIYHDQQFTTLYAGLAQLEVAIGQEVEKGEIIGYSGLMGLAQRPLLHYKVLNENQAVDPLQFFEFKKTFSP